MASTRLKFSTICQGILLGIFVIFLAILFVFLSPIFLLTITQLTVRTLLGLKRRAALEGKLPLAFLEGAGVRTAVYYIFILSVVVFLFNVIIQNGNHLTPLSTSSFQALNHFTSEGGPFLLRQSLVALLVVVLLGQLLGQLVSRAGQPRVVGEILAGLALGPSLLGAIAPSMAKAILPGSVGPVLYVLSNIGIILFMFDTGLKLDGSVLKHRFDRVFMISQVSILAPMLIGLALALVLYPIYGSQNVPFLIFALFVGVAVSITAFPVLARILADRGMTTSAIGSLALSCAAADDIAAWCLLAVVVGIARSNLGEALTTLFLTATFVIVLIGVLRPAVAALLKRWENPALSRNLFTIVLIAVFGMALITDLIGIHAIFGAFMLGAIIPRQSRLAQEFGPKVSDLISVLFLPAFFAYTGMRTQIGLLSNAIDLWLCALIVGAATLGKFGGSFITARLMGLKARESAALGALLNTRGLMELVVLNIGLDFGIISPTLFSAMVIMALLTTFATCPALDLILREKEWKADGG